MSAVEDERIALLLRTIRRELDLTQRDLANAAGVSRRIVLRVEAGDSGAVPLDALRRLFAAVDGRARLVAWWRGAEADRLVDERHAALVERAVGLLRRRAWETAVEASFSEFGERGSIDVLGAHRALRAAAVCEVKASLGSIEETNRTLDVKARLAPKLVAERFGFVPVTVGRILILPDRMTLRRVVDRHGETMAAAYPARGREVRAWLRRPDGPLRGIWFLSEVPD